MHLISFTLELGDSIKPIQVENERYSLGSEITVENRRGWICWQNHGTCVTVATVKLSLDATVLTFCIDSVSHIMGGMFIFWFIVSRQQTAATKQNNTVCLQEEIQKYILAVLLQD